MMIKNGANKMKFKDIVKELRLKGVKEMTEEFHGSGDSGDHDGMISEPHEPSQDMISTVENIRQYMDESLGVDWWNNEGGFGKFTLDVDEGLATMEITQYDNETASGADNSDFENNEDMQKAFENGVETIEGTFGGHNAEIEELTITPASNTIGREALSEFISERVDDVEIEQPNNATESREYYNGEFEIKLGDKISKIEMKVDEEFEVEGDTSSMEIDADDEDEDEDY